MNSRIVGLCLCAATYLPSAFSHDLYIMPDHFRVIPGQNLTIELHNGDAFPESEGPPAAQRVQDTRMIGNGVRIQLKDFQEQHKALVTHITVADRAQGTLILTASLSANSRAYDPKKFQAYLEDEGLSMVSKYRQSHGEQDQPVKELYSKYAKSLIVNGKSSIFSTRPVGFKIEIVPLVDPATLKPGSSMPLVVLVDGKPASGLTIESTWTTGEAAKPTVVGHTDDNGKLSVPMRNGKCRITTGYSQRYPDQAVANWETFFATLTFEVTD